MASLKAPPEHLLAVGRISGVYGVKGWVKIDSSTEPKAAIFDYQPWYVFGLGDAGQDGVELDRVELDHVAKGEVAQGQAKQKSIEQRALAKSGIQVLEIDRHKTHGKGYTGHIKGVDDRDLAQIFCRRDIFVEKSQLPVLGSNEYYRHQLDGLKVYSIGDVEQTLPGDRVLLGEIRELIETGANDVLVVKSCSGSLDTRERLVPWLDEFLYSVDLDKGEVEVRWDPEF